jgi:hypothetical protein
MNLFLLLACLGKFFYQPTAPKIPHKKEEADPATAFSSIPKCIRKRFRLILVAMFLSQGEIMTGHDLPEKGDLVYLVYSGVPIPHIVPCR